MSKYKNLYSRLPSQVNLVNHINYKEIERRKRIDKILSYMESLGLTPRSHYPKPKKTHLGKPK
jgi:hypothetical protein